MDRSVTAGSLARAQADFFLPVGSLNRVVGVSPSSLSVKTFANNLLLSWPIADGTTVLDSSVSSGIVYFNQISGASGFYGVRFFPDRTGFWRLIISSASLVQEVVLEFDVTAPPATADGLMASFVP